MLIMAENGSRENLLAGLRVFVRYFPSQIPLHRSIIAVPLMFSFYLADL